MCKNIRLNRNALLAPLGIELTNKKKLRVLKRCKKNYPYVQRFDAIFQLNLIPRHFVWIYFVINNNIYYCLKRSKRIFKINIFDSATIID